MEKPTKTNIVALAQKVPLAEILDIAEDVAKTIPAAGVPIKIVIKILRLLRNNKTDKPCLYQKQDLYFTRQQECWETSTP